MKIRFTLAGAAPADVAIRVVGKRGEVRRFALTGVQPGVETTQTWDGLTATGRPVAEGPYTIEIGAPGGPEQVAGRLRLHGHFFPVRRRHGTRGGIGAFGAPRNGGRTHGGFDITGACGTPLAAARTGTVLRTGYDPILYGNFVLIKGLGEPFSYFYAHLVKPPLVQRGEHVQTGQIVGNIGQTGDAASTPCHLHFEIHFHGRRIDPAPFLRRWDRYS